MIKTNDLLVLLSCQWRNKGSCYTCGRWWDGQFSVKHLPGTHINAYDQKYPHMQWSVYKHTQVHAHTGKSYPAFIVLNTHTCTHFPLQIFMPNRQLIPLWCRESKGVSLRSVSGHLNQKQVQAGCLSCFLCAKKSTHTHTHAYAYLHMFFHYNIIQKIC